MTPDISRRQFILLSSAAAGSGLAYLRSDGGGPTLPVVGGGGEEEDFGSTAGRGAEAWLFVAADEVREVAEDTGQTYNGVTIRPGGTLKFDNDDSVTLTGGN